MVGFNCVDGLSSRSEGEVVAAGWCCLVSTLWGDIAVAPTDVVS